MIMIKDKEERKPDKVEQKPKKIKKCFAGIETDMVGTDDLPYNTFPQSVNPNTQLSKIAVQLPPH